VTAIGMSQDDASKQIEQMHGNHRVPTILNLVDGLSRDSECSARTGSSDRCLCTGSHSPRIQDEHFHDIHILHTRLVS
jgi:hypothetical protein